MFLLKDSILRVAFEYKDARDQSSATEPILQILIQCKINGTSKQVDMDINPEMPKIP